MRGVLDVHQALLGLGVPHEVVRVRGQVIAVADDLPRALGVPASSCLAVRCYLTDQGLAAVVVQAEVVPHPTAVLDALGARTLRSATPDEINAATDYAAGLVSPVGLPTDVPLLLDAALVAGSPSGPAGESGSPVVYCPVGEGGVALGIRLSHLLMAVHPQVVALSSLPLVDQRDAPWRGGGRVIDLDGSRTASRQRRSAG